MAQTKRKRQTKHRGNAAGVIEARGRTGRKPTVAEKSPGARDAARAKSGRVDRRDKPPTWKSSIYRSAAAAVLMLILAMVTTRRVLASVILFPIVFVLYVPVSYYSDLWIYRRRQRKLGEGGGGGAGRGKATAK